MLVRVLRAMVTFCEGMIGVSHKHKCEECGRVWRHTPLASWSEAQHMSEHLCPNCGAMEKSIYIGAEEPRDAERGIVSVPMPAWRGEE